MAFAGYFAGEAGGFGPGKMKRKDVEDVSEEFSEFSLSAPARKIRRLDVGLPPIIEEEESTAPFHFTEAGTSATFAGAIDVEPSHRVNEERALVVYQGVSSPSSDSVFSSNVSFRVSPNFISNFKDHFYRSHVTKREDGLTREDDKAGDADSCLAVVPWVPSQLHGAANSTGEEVGINLDEQMELEEDTVMDVEETQQQEAGGAVAGGVMAPGLQQWQQYCMTPQVPASSYSSTPVMWFR